MSSSQNLGHASARATLRYIGELGADKPNDSGAVIELAHFFWFGLHSLLCQAERFFACRHKHVSERAHEVLQPGREVSLGPPLVIIVMRMNSE